MTASSIGSVANRDGTLVDEDHLLVSSQIIDDRTFHTVIPIDMFCDGVTNRYSITP